MKSVRMMEQLQTETTCSYEKDGIPQNSDLQADKEQENLCAANGINGTDEIDTLDLIESCEMGSVASNSDVWNASDSEDESFDKKGNDENVAEASNLQSEKENAVEKPAAEDETNKEENSTTTPDEKEKDNEDPPARETVENEINEKENGENKETELETGEEGSDNKPKENGSGPKTDDNKEKDEISSTEKDAKTSDEIPDEVGNKSKESDEISSTEADGKSSDEIPDEAGNKNVELDEQAKTTEATNDTEINTSDKPSDISTNGDKAEDAQEKEAPNDENMSKSAEHAEEDEQMDYDMDEDLELDPSLLCPEVSMDVDENPVITTNAAVPGDGSSSPLPYEPSFSTFVDEVTGAEISFNLTAEEQEIRKRLYGPTNPVEKTRLHCTACNVHLGSALQGQNNRFVHPLLKVLICKECYHFYTSGDFDKDEDGSELYCRWCGQGGQVLCCSKCEFVFCKRCIRSNFSRKKMVEIRDSDSWECFRCSPSQIMTQRISCYEFFEYIRAERTRASTLNDSEYWAKDHSLCCSGGGKKRPADENIASKKIKRKKLTVDPDYNPDAVVEQPSEEKRNVNNSGKSIPFLNKELLKKHVTLLPKFNNQKKDNDIEFVRTIPAPRVVLNPVRSAFGMPGPGYRTIFPDGIRTGFPPPPNLMRFQNPPRFQMPPLVPTATPRLLTQLMNTNRGPSPTTSTGMMKHEWFEKTVRAAARVNSNLSFTLTQLNKAQTQASTVEELAVVHNKLQEILSSSINSLIQIRKNLRTEFITGIKTLRLPPKKKPEEAFNNDDDVIFVSAPATMVRPSTSQEPPPMINNAIFIVDNNNVVVNGDKPSSSSTPSFVPPARGYLKVKSVKDLQNVPAECITIPDDPPFAPVLSNNSAVDPLSYNAFDKDNVNPLSNTVGKDNVHPFSNAVSKDNVNPLSNAVAKDNVKNVKPTGKCISTALAKNDSTEKKRLGKKEVKPCKVILQRVDLEKLQKQLRAK